MFWQASLAGAGPDIMVRLDVNVQSTQKSELCNEMRGVNYRQMVSKAAHKDLVPVRWNDVR